MLAAERTQPQNEAYERAVLGACLGSAESVAQAVEALRPADFYRPAHGRLFAVIAEIYRKGEPVDFLTVTTRDMDDTETRMLALDVQGEHVTSAHAPYYIEQLVRLSRRRAAIAACHAALADLHSDDVEDGPSRALGHLMAAQVEAAGKAVEIGIVAEEVVEATRRAYERHDRGERAQVAFETGLYDLDRLYLASPGDYVVCAARPSAGKTSAVIQIIHHAASAGVPVYLVSLEMERGIITRRLLAQMTGISTERQRTGVLTQDERGLLASAARQLQALKTLYIDDRPGLTIAQIMAAAQVHKAKHGLGLLVVDHLSLVTYANPRSSAYEGMTQVSKDVKTMARRLAVPTIAVAQLSRDVEKGDRKPRMSDLRDSGSLEQDADSIWLLHRPDRTSSHAAAELVVVKNRNGKCGDVELYFDAERTLFRSVEWKAASA